MWEPFRRVGFNENHAFGFGLIVTACLAVQAGIRAVLKWGSIPANQYEQFLAMNEENIGTRSPDGDSEAIYGKDHKLLAWSTRIGKERVYFRER